MPKLIAVLPLLFATHELGEAEVGDFHAAALVDENVLGLDIAMDDPFIVGKLQCVANLRHDRQGLAGIEPGRLVTFYDVYGICGSCWHCLVAKAGTRCPHRRVYGITTSAADGLLGGWSERIDLRPGVRILPLPAGLEAEDFMGGGCGLPTGFHAVERAAIALGDTVVVQGSGPVGLNAAIFAQLAGALRVVMIGAPRARPRIGPGSRRIGPRALRWPRPHRRRTG